MQSVWVEGEKGRGSRELRELRELRESVLLGSEVEGILDGEDEDEDGEDEGRVIANKSTWQMCMLWSSSLRFKIEFEIEIEAAQNTKHKAQMKQ